MDDTPKSPRFLTGKDYPWLCPKCQKAVDDIALMYIMGMFPDTDDNEAPIVKAGDLGRLCGLGGRECDPEEAK